MCVPSMTSVSPSITLACPLRLSASAGGAPSHIAATSNGGHATFRNAIDHLKPGSRLYTTGWSFRQPRAAGDKCVFHRGPATIGAGRDHEIAIGSGVERGLYATRGCTGILSLIIGLLLSRGRHDGIDQQVRGQPVPVLQLEDS